MPSCRPGNGIGGTRARTTVPRLGAGAGTGRSAGTSASDRVAGGGKDSLQVAGTAMGTGQFHLILLVHHQDFQVFVTVQAFEFEYRHLGLLLENFFKKLAIISKLSSDVSS